MTGQKPSQARMVLVPTLPALNNGRSTAPAVIVGVNSDTSVNVRVFTDSSNVPEWRTSVELVDELPEYVEGTAPMAVWCWPPRV